MDKPVTVWLANTHGKLMASFTKDDVADFVIIGPIDETVVQIPEEEVREYVLIPASEYVAKPPPVLSPVAELIARLAVDLLVADYPIADASPIPLAVAVVKDAIEAARKIEGGKHG